MRDVVVPGGDMVTNGAVGDFCADSASLVANSSLSSENAGWSGGTSVVANYVVSGAYSGCDGGTCGVYNVTVSSTNTGWADVYSVVANVTVSGDNAGCASFRRNQCAHVCIESIF